MWSDPKPLRQLAPRQRGRGETTIAIISHSPQVLLQEGLEEEPVLEAHHVSFFLYKKSQASLSNVDCISDKVRTAILRAHGFVCRLKESVKRNHVTNKTPNIGVFCQFPNSIRNFWMVAARFSSHNTSCKIQFGLRESLWGTCDPRRRFLIENLLNGPPIRATKWKISFLLQFIERQICRRQIASCIRRLPWPLNQLPPSF